MTKNYPVLYIAGPMTGLPEYNFPAFYAAQSELEAWGYSSESPTDNGDDKTKPWHWYMKRGFMQMLQCDGLAYLPGWENSKGATLEIYLARQLDMPVKSVEQWVLDAVKEVEGDQGRL